MSTPTDRIDDVLVQLRRVLVGQSRMQERLLVGLLSRGHVLLESVPGLAKTLAAESLATIVGGEFARIQFTPDLLPSDVMGTRIYRPSQEEFDIELGPVFTNILLADEINRAPAKVQSALLEVMAEHQVSIGGRSFAVPEPFFVIATQNPIESEGVYALPEAQRDRFMMKVVMTHPDRTEELQIVDRVGVTTPVPDQVLDPGVLRDLQAVADRVFVDATVKAYAVDVVQATRRPAAFGLGDLDDLVELGASPRASLGLVRGARSLALMRGRSFATAQDVYDIAPEVLRHRIMLTYEALARDVDADDVIARVLATVPAQPLTSRNHDQAPRSGPSAAASGLEPLAAPDTRGDAGNGSGPRSAPSTSGATSGDTGNGERNGSGADGAHPWSTPAGPARS